ncbi:MAG: glycosyltransferase family 2 protein [Glaciimonas sp.]|nr:glycosyltransferase family 2 protein [Glaciimonas sp.]
MLEDSCCVLILNYQSHQDTIDYVAILQKQKCINLRILIVDNCSPNNSFTILVEHFKSTKNVEVIQSERNGGYAYGNNYGLRYLESASTDYILVSNNDIEIDDQMLLFKLIKKYKQLDRPAFAAPIMHVNGKPSKYAAWKIPTLIDDLIGSLGLLQKIFGNKTVYQINANVDSVAVDCLPGSFFLAKKAIFYNIGLMDEGTFLYMEEVILAYKVKQISASNYLIASLTYDHATSKTISSQLSSVKMRNHLINSRVYFHRKYLKTGKFGINLLISLFYVWILENYLWSKFKSLR